ncbi:MAG: hypothetical protein HYS27_03000 [Deltaproteobacteria bacterium]|nr:hypothetical protein [Deltaproteobacteria bacterium]
MRRVDAIALKQFALAEILAEVRRHVGAHPVVAFAGRRTPPRGERLAVGVVPSSDKDRFRLAVRLTAQAQASSPLVLRLKREAGRDLDLALVGAIRALPPADAVHATAAKGAAQRRRQRPVEAGSSVAHHDVTAGTLGAVVRDRARRLHLLSNNHVLAAVNQGKRGDAVVQPSPQDHGDVARDRVARLSRWVRLLPRGRGRNLVDAALASLDPDVEARFTIAGRSLRGVRARVLPELRVWKLGRTTGHTRGRVSAVLLDEVEVCYADGTVCVFDDQLEIVGLRGAFSSYGDSGSLVVDEEDRAIGLLYAGSEQGGPAGSGRSYAAPIATVLRALDVTLPRASG